MDYVKRAQELAQETVANRRWFHQNAETGLHMPKGCQYVIDKLAEYGIEARRCGEGVTATIGKGGKCILLRADMDALPLKEESGLPFACPTGTEAHCCGHDMHAAMLLTAAKMLKENEENLEGTVKLMFQPAEETFEGAKNMVEAGILEDPKVDAAVAFHVGPGKLAPGNIGHAKEGAYHAAVYGFKITIQGKGSHGAHPHAGVDPINIGVHIHLALQELISREIDPMKNASLTIGTFRGGIGAANVIPDTCEMMGTVRCFDADVREHMMKRVPEVAASVAATYRGSAVVETLSDCPSEIIDKDLAAELDGYMQTVPGTVINSELERTSGSEDFAEVCARVPGVFYRVFAGFPDDPDKAQWPGHHPKVMFNEDILTFGPAYHCLCADGWLKNHK